MCLSNIRRAVVLSFIIVVACHFVAPTSSFGQASTKGTITGTVTDPTGAVIPGAEITISNIETGFTRTITTDQSGNYTAISLDPGSYRVEVLVQGFQRAIRAEIRLAVQATAHADFELQIGQVSEEVVVEGREEILQTTQTSVAGLVTDQQILRLPTLTRRFTDLMRTQMGVVDPEMVNPEFGASGAGGFANGQRIDTNTFTLDGSNLNDPGFPGNAISTTRPIPLEAIKEYAVQLSNPDATFGTSSGAQVAMTTKSGTNDFHGSLFYSHRNNVFNAADFFNPSGEASPLKTHQFGFSIGGPIVEDKTFFFGTYEGFREGRGLVIGGNVPSEALLVQVPDDAAHGFLQSVMRVSYLKTPDVVPAGACAPPFTGLSAAGCTGRGTFTPTSDFVADTFLIRIDHQFSPNDRLYGRYYYTKNEGPSRYLFSPSGTSDFFSIKRNYNFLVSYDHIFSPTAANTFRASFYRPVTRFPPFGSRPELNQFGINGDDFHAADSLPFIIFAGTGMSLLGQFPIFPFARPQYEVQVNDDFTLVRGAHQLRFGIERYQIHLNETISNNLRPFLLFIGFGNPFFPVGVTDGNSLSLEQNIPVDPDNFQRGYRQINWGLYITDTHRVTNKVTFNYGLRWEYYGIPHERNGALHNLYQADSSGSPIPDVRITDFTNVVLAQAGDCSGCLNFFKKTYTNFQPRFGIAYQVLPKTVVRAGYSLIFNPWYYEQFNSVRFNAPETVSVLLNFQPFGTTATLASAVGAQNAYGVDPGFTPAYTQSWSLFIQQGITADSSFKIGYVGNKGTKLSQLLTPNFGASPSTPRPNSNFAIIDLMTTTGLSTYHGLQTEFLHRFSKGLIFQVNYTWAKSLDNASISHTVFGRDRIVPQNSFAPRDNYGPSDFDISHLLRGNWFYELPFGEGKPWAGSSNKVARTLLSGWNISGIFTVQTGHPFNILSGIDSNGDGNNNDRAVFLSGTVDQLLASGGDPAQYLSATVACPAGQPAGAVCTQSGVVLGGDYSLGAPIGRNSVEGPSMANFDLVLGKTTQLTETVRMEFKAEFYNAFNITNFQPPDPGPNQITSPTFGRILLTRTRPRELQFSLRFEF